MISGPFLFTDEELKAMTEHMVRNWHWFALGLVVASALVFTSGAKGKKSEEND
jgi:hypothetical protein